MTTHQEATTVVGVFENVDRAEAAVRALLEAGIPRDEVSLLSGHHAGAARDTGSEIPENVAGGAVFGGLGGLLLGLAAMAIPGMGALVAAGPIASTLAGAGVGAAGGGIIGILKDSGIPHDEAGVYAQNVQRGRTLVAVHSREANHDRIAELLDSFGAIDIEDSEEAALSSDRQTKERGGITTLGISEPGASGSGGAVVAEENPTAQQYPSSEESGMGIGPHELTPSGFRTRGIENPVVARRHARIYGR